MIDSNTSSIFNSDLVICFAFFMLILFFMELIMKKDFKPAIISLGILGTFIGISIGLWEFDTSDIKSSVPHLLEGLKTAFITSILGMFFSVFLSILENFLKPKEEEINDPSAFLRSINDKMSQLVKNPKDQNLDIFKKIPDQVTSIEESSKKTKETMELIHQSINQSQKNTADHFAKIDTSLNKAVETLSKGATEEIIKALKQVISDFNSNLTEQFGENFKQLNESVKKMIQWQENYKSSIEEIEKSLDQNLTALKTNSEHMDNLRSHYQSFSQTNEDLRSVIKANEDQIKNIEAGMKSLKQIGDEAGVITKSINDFSKTIKGSLSDQSAGLNKLQEKLNSELNKSLDNLNTSLTTLTNKFKSDYDIFLQHIKKLMGQ